MSLYRRPSSLAAAVLECQHANSGTEKISR